MKGLGEIWEPKPRIGRLSDTGSKQKNRESVSRRLHCLVFLEAALLKFPRARNFLFVMAKKSKKGAKKEKTEEVSTTQTFGFLKIAEETTILTREVWLL